jgi:hypothetical protein
MLFAAVFTATPIIAAPKAATTPAPAVKAAAKKKVVAAPLQATVKSVTGIVEKLSGDDKHAKWRPLKPGEKLSEQTVIRTGLGARVVLTFADRGQVTVKSGTKIGISSFRKSGKLVKTRLGLKYGAIRAQVDSSRGSNDFRVRTPVATLAATGTSGNIAQWGDFSFQCKGTSGSWRAKTPLRTIAVRRGEWTNRQGTPSIRIALAKLDPKIGDIHGGLTRIEVKQLQRNSGPIKTQTFRGRHAFARIRRVPRHLIARLPVKR